MAETIDPRVDIGHVHLKVADLERALAFYRDILGFELMQRMGDQAAFLCSGASSRRAGRSRARPTTASPSRST